MIIVFFLLTALFLVAVYGAIQLYLHADKVETANVSLEGQIKALKTRVSNLEDMVNALSPKPRPGIPTGGLPPSGSIVSA